MRTKALASALFLVTALTLGLVFSSDTSVQAAGRCADFNGDDRVTIGDVFRVAQKYGRTLTSPDWDPAFDLNGNRAVDIGDVLLTVGQFGRVCAPDGSELEFQKIEGVRVRLPEVPNIGLIVARSAEEWATISDDPPPVDFSSEIVVGVYGHFPSSGYYLQIDRIVKEVGSAVVYATLRYPGPNCIVLPILTSDVHLVRVWVPDFWANNLATQPELPFKLVLQGVEMDCGGDDVWETATPSS